MKREMTTLTPAAVFPVPGTPDWQVMTEDAVWVSNGPKNTIHRLDPKTNQVMAAIEVGKRPCSGLAAGFGSVWVPVCGDRPGTENGARPALTRVDIKTNQVTATIPVGPANSEGGLVASPEAVWMVTDPKGTLSRIDPATNKVAAEIAVAPGSVACVYAEGAVWVSSPGEERDHACGPEDQYGDRYDCGGAGSAVSDGGRGRGVDAQSGRWHGIAGRYEDAQAGDEY